MNLSGNALKTIEQFSIAVVLASLGYLIFFLFYHHEPKLMPAMDVIETEKTAAKPAKVLPDLDMYETYAQKTGGRDLFSSTSAIPIALANQAALAHSSGLPGHLKLVGVLIDSPSQVMIENTTSHATYFINEGETQQGIGVLKVSRDLVELNYDGKAVTLDVKELNAGK